MSEQRTVKFLDLSETIVENIKTIGGVMKSGKFILSENVLEFERNFAEYCGAEYCIGVGNGFDALQIILRSIGVGNGDRVLVPSNAPLPVYMSVSALGAEPIPVEPYTYGHVLDPVWLHKSFTIKTRFKNTKAMIAVHLYGLVAPIDALKGVCEGLPIIEDCCQAHGSFINGVHVGNAGIAGAFSFYPTKNLGAYGDGGAIITNDDKIAEAAYDIREYGKGKRVGINSRLDELQAALLITRLDDLDAEIGRRISKATVYVELLKDLDSVDLPMPMGGSRPSWHQFVIITEKRDALKSFLEKQGIETMIHYPVPAWRMPAYGKHWAFPISDWQSRHVLSLPIGRGVTIEDVVYVCEKIRTFHGENV